MPKHFRRSDGHLVPLVEAKGLQIKIDTPPAGVVVQTDWCALNQIHINLGNNAVKFTETGEIRLGLIERSEQGRAEVVFSVVDTGTDIRPDAQARLFRAFEQVGSGNIRR